MLNSVKNIQTRKKKNNGLVEPPVWLDNVPPGSRVIDVRWNEDRWQYRVGTPRTPYFYYSSPPANARIISSYTRADGITVYAYTL